MTLKYTIDTNITKLNKIIHLADIHIRLYRRHSEYTEVFNRLYEHLSKRDLKNAAIVVTGDVVHAKTDMSPEMVAITSDFLNSLANLAPTIVIAGNHDLNLSNPNRMDALSPIVENLQNSQLHYLKKSGVYKFADVEFGVNAITSQPDEWPSISDFTPNVTKIALFHGPLNKAQTSTGHTITNRITVEQFNGYDMVLLGDIHTTQILQEYGGDGVPEIFYAGSLIQQNHGELLTGHGYGVWDVATRKVEDYVEIPNSFGYHTIRLMDTTMPNINCLPQNLRLRLMVGAIDSTVVKKVLAAIRKHYNVVECIVNKLSDKQTTTSGTNAPVDNIVDVNYQNSLIKSYIETHLVDAGPDLTQRILDINTQLNTRIGDDELPKNINWRPLKLTFDNLFSYGEGNSINFADMNGLYGIFSPNATGKTSAFDAMCFALYDKTPRAFKGSHIMNTRCDSFACELTFEIDKVVYIIERTGSRKKNGEVKVDVNFYRMEDEEKISLNGDDRRDTNAAIRSYVGTYEDFILTSLSVQNQNSLFIETGQTDRKDLLSQFIGLTVFDRLFTIASNEIKEVVGALKTFRKDDFTQKLAEAQKQIEANQKMCDSIQSNVTEAIFETGVIDNLIKSLYEQKIPEIPDIDVAPIQKRLQEIAIESTEQRQAIEEYLFEINECKILKFELSDKLSEYSSTHSLTDLKTEYDDLLRMKSVVAKLQSDIKLLRMDADNKRDKLEKLKEHKYDPNCSFCMNNVFVKDAQLTQTQYDSVLHKIDELDDKLFQSTEYVSKHMDVELRYKTAMTIKDELQTVEIRLANLTVSCANHTQKDEALNREMTNLSGLLSKYDSNKVAIENNRSLQLKIDELEQKKISLDKVLKQFQTDLRNHDRELSVVRAKKDDMLKTIKDAEELETTYEAYETYLNVIGRDGLPYELISQVIPTLQTEVNNILAQIVDFSISLEVDGKNINGRILYEDDRTWPLELASGMEKFISGLAIRVALMTVSNLPKSNFLVIDEGLGVLDSDNLASMSVLFNILKTQFDFLILISHLDTVRDVADTLIDIKREDGFSYILVE